jgi:pimeloyl-ACP methyl ester carboxylesterase
VSSRRRTLPCEAVHTHTFEMEVDEAGAWTAWLSRRGHRVVVLVGHSSGAAAILPHLPRPHPAVGGAFLIGLPDPDRQMPDAERRRLVRDLARLIADAGYRLVAEGIESAEMLEAAKAAGFHKAQGFHLGAPAPPP